MSKKNQTQKNKKLKNSADTSNKKMFYLKITMFTLSGAIMIGHGARMMYQGLFQPHSYYPAPTPSTIDFYFDWMILATLGLLVLGYTIYAFYQYHRRKEQKFIP